MGQMFHRPESQVNISRFAKELENGIELESDRSANLLLTETFLKNAFVSNKYCLQIRGGFSFVAYIASLSASLSNSLDQKLRPCQY